MPKIFISHSSGDREFVEREINDILQRCGLEIWYAPRSIRPGDRFAASIVRGLESCDWFLVVMSPRSVESEWVLDEVHWAMDNRKSRVIPVLMEDCDPSHFHP